MRKVSLSLVILIFLIDCGREWNNPFDPSASITKSEWTPKNFNIEQTSLNSFQLNWEDVDANIEGYKIHRKVGGGPWIDNFIKISPDTQLVIDSTVEPKTSQLYSYKLVAYAGKNESKEVINTLYPSFPAVSNLQTTQISPSEVKIQWVDETDGEDGFYIDRLANSEYWTRLDTLPENSTVFYDSTTIINETNYYKVTAFYGTYRSEEATTDLNSIFQAPTDLTITKQSMGALKLNWTDNSEGEEGFCINRKVGDGSWIENYATVAQNITEYIDENVVPNVTYHYSIRAYHKDVKTSEIRESVNMAFSMPDNLHIDQENLYELNLIWNDNSEGEEGFKVYRQDEAGQWQLLTTTIYNFYTDENPHYGWNHYKLYAFFEEFKTDSLEKSLRNIIVNPNNLMADVVDATTVKLTWENFCHFNHKISVERKTIGGEFNQIALVNFGTNTYTDFDVDSTLTYEYAVRGFVDPYYSDFSNIDTIQIIPDLPFEMVEVVAGNFTYGQNDETQTIDYDYEIMKYEVTNEQYAIFLQEVFDNGKLSVTSNSVKGNYSGDDNFPQDSYLYYDLGDEDARIKFNNNKFFVISNYENHPVTEITWFGASAFAKYYHCSLPSEFEWEKAARGNTGHKYPWGNDFVSYYCNYHNSGDPFDNGTTPVGYYDGSNHGGYVTLDNRSYYGAFDMAGNVWEWTSDWNLSSTDKHTVRGGSWYNSESLIFAYYNSLSYNPTLGYGYVGFRLVKKY